MTRILAALLLWTAAAWGVDATQVILPGYVGFTFQTNAAANTMYCHVVVAPFSINGTKMAAAYTSSTGSAQTCGFAIYNNDGSSQLAEIAASCTATGGGILTVTGQTINLTAGAEYTICHCRSATNVSNTYLTAMNSATAGMNYGPNFLGISSKAYEATTSCTSGNPPSSTGGAAGATTQGPPILVIE